MFSNKSFLGSIIAMITMVTLLGLGGCDREDTQNSFKVGTIAGPETELMEVAKKVAAEKYGLDITIVEFSDYAMPNTALQEGSIDANMFQHQPYLTQTNKERHFDLVPICKTFIFPMGLYSKKWRHLSELPEYAVVAIPNDPTNEARALLLLQHAKLIRLRSGVSTEATLEDISSNHKHLQIKSLDAAQLPRILPDVDLAAINTNYAIPAGLIPTRDALRLESRASLYANLLVIRADKDNPRLRKLVDALHSPEVKHEAGRLFHGQAIPAW